MEQQVLLNGMPIMGGLGTLAMLSVAWGLVVTVFWMACAWRAMRAHQRLAEAVEIIAKKLGEPSAQ